MPCVYGRTCNFMFKDENLILPYLPMQREPRIMILASLCTDKLKSGCLTISWLLAGTGTALGLELALVQSLKPANNQLIIDWIGHD